ncbi:hypothetical protein ACFSM5_11590 [Lacibacterium aquatile]|uniref:Uncharacterized protein n=1 Tax=Lacibacterium aquatile TaxID=1168082 RepID=A0ABW5DQU4_9PROT
MSTSDQNYAQAVGRLEAAVQRLESAIHTRPSVPPEELNRLSGALRAAEDQNSALVAANRKAAERLESTIGRLRGLLNG